MTIDELLAVIDNKLPPAPAQELAEGPVPLEAVVKPAQPVQKDWRSFLFTYISNNTAHN